MQNCFNFFFFYDFLVLLSNQVFKLIIDLSFTHKGQFCDYGSFVLFHALLTPVSDSSVCEANGFRFMWVRTGWISRGFSINQLSEVTWLHLVSLPKRLTRTKVNKLCELLKHVWCACTEISPNTLLSCLLSFEETNRFFVGCKGC